MLGWNEDIKKTFGACGKNVFIGHNVLFANPQNVYLDDNVRIDPFTWITTGLKVGKNVQICSHAVLGGGAQHTITIGNWCFIGYGSKLFCASEDYSGDFGPVNEFWGSNKIFRGDIVFDDYAGIASDVMVFPGVVFPEGCAIGAKSLVHTKNQLLPWCVYIGTPTLLHKTRNKDSIIALSLDTSFIKNKLPRVVYGEK